MIRRWGGTWLGAVSLLAIASVPLNAQEGVLVEGRVESGGTEAGIPNAIVELLSHGASLTTAEGMFRFERVVPGAYTLRVSAFGYMASETIVRIPTREDLRISLTPDPLGLDSLVVELKAARLEGRVRSASQELPVYEADVLINGVSITRTSPGGRFEIKPVWEGVPLLLSVRAFGYLPADTVIAPGGDGVLDLLLSRDPVIDRMLEIQIERLEERPTGTPAIGMPTLDRERLMRWRGVTLLEVLDGTLTTRVDRIKCVVIDERLVHPTIDSAVLASTLPGEIERMEFLFGGAMLRIYSRDFMRNLLAGSAELATPVYVGMVDPPLCG